MVHEVQKELRPHNPKEDRTEDIAHYERAQSGEEVWSVEESIYQG